MHLAILGLGRMGRALASRLLEGGHELVVWNRTDGYATDLVDAGAREAPSVAAAVGGAEVVITMLANDRAVHEVALGAGGVRTAIDADAVYIDSSTVSPELSAKLAETFAHFVAMPVMGRPEAVASGEAAYLVGGDPTDVKRLGPVLDSLSPLVRRFDRAGLATSAKITGNLLLLAGVAALAEAFAVGRAGGLPDETLRDLLGDSPLVAPALKNRFEAVLAGAGEGWWSTSLGVKDAGLALDLAGAAGVALPVASAVGGVYQNATDAGLGDDDIAVISRLYRARSA
jgi:3-hydroxyisobutyrate dehydrogenase-like beta-hydroxyacid dehydrogenase